MKAKPKSAQTTARACTQNTRTTRAPTYRLRDFLALAPAISLSTRAVMRACSSRSRATYCLASRARRCRSCSCNTKTRHANNTLGRKLVGGEKYDARMRAQRCVISKPRRGVVKTVRRCIRLLLYVVEPTRCKACMRRKSDKLGVLQQPALLYTNSL